MPPKKKGDRMSTESELRDKLENCREKNDQLRWKLTLAETAAPSPPEEETGN